MDTPSSPLSALVSALTPFTQERRLFALQFEQPEFDTQLLPLTLQGREQLSETYRVDLVCLSSDAAIALKQLLGLGVDITIHTGSDDRIIAGIVTGAQRLSADGGFARYGLTVEPALAALRLRRNSRVFQDKSVVDIVRLLLDEQIARNPVFTRHFRHHAELVHNYPLRSFCQQYRESDLAFIERLLREEGISYRFDFSGNRDDIGLHTLVLFDHNDALPTCAQSSLRFHRASATECDDTLTEWSALRQIQSSATQLASFDYKRVYTQNGNEPSAVDHGDAGSALISTLQNYDPQTLYYGTNDSDLTRYATLRQQADDLLGKCFHGRGVVRALAAGQYFTLEQHPAHDSDMAADREFVVLGQQFHARNNFPDSARRVSDNDNNDAAEAGYWHHFNAVRRSVPIVPTYNHADHARPTASGPQSATVVGPAGQPIFTDELGRIKIQFHWARTQDHDVAKQGASADRNDFSSCWVRVMMPSAGAGFGHQFIPRVGQEVLVDFIEGDIDRPVVIRALHNGQQQPPTFSNSGSLPANKTLSGIKSREINGHGHNELIFDDTTGQLRTTLASTHGTSQLNLGYLIHPRQNGKGAPRGEGFELRSDKAGAIRAAQGLLISTEPQPGAGGHQLHRNGAKSQLEAAQTLSQQLGDQASHHHAEPSTPQPPLSTAPLDQRQPQLLLSGEAGIAITSPHAVTVAAGEDIVQITQRDLHQSSARRWLHNVGESISLFVCGNTAKLKQTIKLIAGKGNLLIQAQSDNIELTADKSVLLTACTDSLTASAGSELLLQSGGGYIRISGGNIDIHCPGILSMKATSFVHEAGSSVSIDRPQMPNQDYGSITPIEPGLLDVPILGDVVDGLLDSAALITSAFREDGLTVQPFTGKVLSKPEVQDAKFGALVGAGGLVSKLGSAISSVSKFITPSNTAMFWSGLGRGGDKIAAESAKNQQRITLEQLIQKNGIDMPAWDAADPNSISAWENASKLFAESASGQVKVLTGNRMRPGSIWETVEFPTLRSNPKISDIIQIDADTGAETLVFIRNLQ